MSSAPSAEPYRVALTRLRSAQKPAAQTPAYLRFVNRRLGGYLAVYGYVRGWTPNRMTAISALLSLAGTLAVALVRPTAGTGVLVALLLAAGFAFDSGDGQLARLRGGGSPAGEWLDHVVDTIKSCLLHSATLISLLRFWNEPTLLELSLPLIFLSASITLTFATMLRDQLVLGRGPAERAPDSVGRGLFLLPIDYGTLCLTFALLGQHDVFLAVYGALAVLHVAFVIRLLIRTYRNLAADRVPGTTESS